MCPTLLLMSKRNVIKMTKPLTTKDQLLNVLKMNGEQTIKDIMEHFTISEIAVRRHLQELVREGFVQREKNVQEIGRPYYTYMLTDQGHDTFPNYERMMSVELLEDLEELYGEEAVNELLGKWKEREHALIKSQMKTDDFDEQIKQVAKIREDLGYMVQVEELDEGDYVLQYFNCPVSTVACAYKQLCTKEMEIFEEIFSESEIKVKSMITKGDHYCTWKIKRPVKE